MAEYIERETALSMREPPKSNRQYQTDNLDDAYGQGWDDALCCLEHIPAADVAPVVHGRKIEDGDIGCFWLCSLCGECLPYGANYFPHCGAKMDGGDDHG